jgi:hypothetical protein
MNKENKTSDGWLEEIIILLDVSTWPARCRSLHWFRKLVILFFVILLFATALIFTGHHYRVVVSINGENPDAIAISNLQVVELCVLDVILFVLSFAFMALADHRTKPHAGRPSPRKLRVHVVLPSGPLGGTLGDGLLQAAGFLAAGDAFLDHLEIIPHDHENDPILACNILAEVCEATGEDEPLCLVYTMSRVCEEVAKKVTAIIKDKPVLASRLSVIFTVASAENTPHDGKVLFQHFVRGDQEATKIRAFCKSHREDKKLIDPIVLFLAMHSPYSKQTIKQLVGQLVVEDQFRAQSMFIGPDGNLCAPRTPTDISNWLMNAGDNGVAVSVTYDLPLLGAIRSIIEADFRGYFLATTTFSVPDWQEYLKKKGQLSNLKFRIWYTQVEGFNPQHGAARYFAKQLSPWTFKSVLSQPAFYKDGFAVAEQTFSVLEREVFEVILPNYISAFCFDSVRLFSLMRRKGFLRLRDLDLQTNGATAAYLQKCPFESITFAEGRTDVPVSGAYYENPVVIDKPLP